MNESRLYFNVEWEPAPGVRAPELAATWARLEIWVGGECVTQSVDASTNSSRNSIYVSLYPLAEWIAYSWWFLIAHSRPLLLAHHYWSTAHAGGTGHAWPSLDRHNLRSAGDGMPWPDFVLIPGRDLMWSAWFAESEAPPWRSLRFVQSGEAQLDIGEAEASLAAIVDVVVTRLREQGIRGTNLEDEWAQIRALETEEVHFCVAASQLGLDPFREAHELAGLLIQAEDRLGDDLLADFLNAVDPDDIANGLTWVDSARSRIRSTRVQSRRPASSLPGGGHHANGQAPPWAVGYQGARELREHLDLLSSEPFPVQDYVRIVRSPGTDPSLQALGGISTVGTSVLVAATPTSHTADNFLAARAVWRLPRLEGDVFLLTTSRTEREQTERAFAAELLAPAQGIATALPHDARVIRALDVDRLSRQFGVSALLIEHQAENQLGLATEL